MVAVRVIELLLDVHEALGGFDRGDSRDHADGDCGLGGRVMKSTTAIQIGALLAGGLLLTGCSGESTPSTSTTPSTTAEASPSASSPATPSATSTLTAEEQQAFEEATEVVLAYRQTLVDIYSGASLNLNDLNEVATGDLLQRNLAKAQMDLGEGKRSEPTGVQLALISAEPVRIELDGEPDEVTVRACIDGTMVTSVDAAGIQTSGVRELAEYSLIRTTYLPAPGWAVTRTRVSENPEDRKC